MDRRTLGLTLVALLLGSGALPLMATADILVLKDGSRVQTEGEWEVQGRLVVFRTAGGSLSSIRLDEVDLEASEAATAAAQRAEEEARRAPPPRVERREPVAVLTDRDVARVFPEALGLTDDDPQAAAQAPDRPPWERPVRLQVVDWNETPEAQGLTFVGRVRNISQELTTGLRVTATLYDHDGDVLAVTGAELSTTLLQPGQQATFRARFPGHSHYERVEFETAHVALDTGDAPTPDEVLPGESEEDY
jgi:hypothetical protein